MNPFKIGFQDYKNLHNALKNLGVLVQNIVMWFPYYMSWAQDFMVTLRTFWTFKYREPFLKRKTKPDSLLGISFDKLWRFLTQMSNWLIDKGDPLVSLDFFGNAMAHPRMKVQVLYFGIPRLGASFL